MVDVSEVADDAADFHPCDTPRVHWTEIEEKMLAASKDSTSPSEVLESMSLHLITPKPSDESSLKEIPVLKRRQSPTDTVSIHHGVSQDIPSTASGICAAIVEEIVEKADRELRAKETIELAFRGKTGGDSDPMLDLDSDSVDSFLAIENKEYAEAPTAQ
nr:unnamed protein product [Callosobruchus analis]